MNNIRPFTEAALIGLIAGISHGFISHNAGLPTSLVEQVAGPFQVSQVFQN